ncbi:hypothetical protein FRC09_000410 [Ceratobasidium sp. 395]|nr:hypothetical protein FRC09_000410 [Ceratobasidium sp. 395]
MAIALDSPLLLYTLQTLKEDGQDISPSEEKENTSILDVLQVLPSEPVSIAAFVHRVQHPPPHTPTLYVTSIEWRAATKDELYHEYAVIRASTTPQTASVIAIRVDRFGNLGIKLPWWKLRPACLSAGTFRDTTTIVAGPIGDDIADPSTGSSVIKYTHWTQELPSTAPISELRLVLERARNNACTALNHAIRPYILNGLHMSNKQTRHGRRWADSRGLRFVYADIAATVAEAMDIGTIRCAIQHFWVRVLPSRILWRSVQQNVRAREEYSGVVRDYRQELRRIVQSLSNLDPDARTKISRSWEIEEHENHSPLLIQLLNKSLSKHAFISPHSPLTTMADVASRLDTIVPLLPSSGPSVNMCLIHVRTLLARLPDDLWHAYTTPVPPVSVSTTRTLWHRARDSRTFWVVFEILVQWVVATALIPVQYVSELWVFVLPLIHAAIVIPWVLKERRAWRRIWKVYEGALIQSEDIEWESDLNTLSSQSRVSLLSTKGNNSTSEIPLQPARKLCFHAR